MSQCHIIGCRKLKTICEDCKRTINTTEFEEPKMQWISVKDIPLPKDIQIIMYSAEGKDGYSAKMFIGEYDSMMEDIFCVFGDGFVPFEVKDITHWMPLLSPPKD